MAIFKRQDYINNLPVDIFYRIFVLLGCRTLMSCRCVNRRFNYAITTWPEYCTYERYKKDILRSHGESLRRIVRYRPRALRGLLQAVRSIFAWFGYNYLEVVYTQAYTKANALNYDACFPPKSTLYTSTLKTLALDMQTKGAVPVEAFQNYARKAAMNTTRSRNSSSLFVLDDADDP